MEIKIQNDTNDCGVVVVQALYHYFFKKWIDINILKDKAKLTSSGMSVMNFRILASQFNLNCEAKKGNFLSLSKLKNKDYFITIIKEANFNHFIIIKLFKKFILCIDPLSGKRKISWQDFEKKFLGILITIEPNKKNPNKLNIFKQSKSIFYFLLHYPKIFAAIIILIIIDIILTFVLSMYSKIIIDYVIPIQTHNILFIVTFLFVWITILQLINSFFKNFLLKKLTLKIETNLTFNYFNKIQNSQLYHLNKLNINDHLRRINLLPEVAYFLTNFCFIFFADTSIWLITFIILWWINLKLFLLTLGISFIIIFISLLFHFLLKNQYEINLKKQLNYSSDIMNYIFGYEEMKFKNFASFTKDKHFSNFFVLQKQKYKFWKTNQIQTFLIKFFNKLSPILLTYLATLSIFNHHLSLGEMIMFLTLFSYFINTNESLALFIIKFTISYKYFQLINFVLNFANETNNKHYFLQAKIQKIRLQNIIFGYNFPIFKISEFIIQENIFLIGQNGIGKSTFLKILATYFKPEGHLFFNDIEVKSKNLNNIRSKIFLAHPHSYLPSTTIYEYATLNDLNAEKFFMQNVKKYNLEKFLAKFNLSLEQKIINNGNLFSSGQRQIIVLLRLFAFSFDLILLDEALENIDYQKVEKLAKMIKEIQQGLFVEISHSLKKIHQGKEVNFAEIIKN